MADQQPRVKLGELLVQSRVLTPEKLAEALALQKSEQAAGRPRRLGRLLVEKGFVEETQMTQILGKQLAVPWVSLYHVDFSRQLLNLVPREVAEAYTIVPVYVRNVRGQGDTLYVATDDPTNTEGLERVQAFAALPVRPMIASATDIKAAIRVYYGGGSAAPQAQNAAPAPPPPGRPAGAVPAEPPPPAPPSSDQPLPSTTPARKSRDEPPPSTIADAPHARERTSEPRTDVKIQVVEAPKVGSDVPTIVDAKPPPPKAIEPAAQRPPKPQPVEDDTPQIEAKSIPIPPRKGARRAIALTFLDGTTISLPAPRTRGQGGGGARTRPRDSAPISEPTSGTDGEDELTARDLVSALRAVSHGVDASEILGDNPRWEKMFAALLSLLLRKHLIADWEFVEEYRKI